MKHVQGWSTGETSEWLSSFEDLRKYSNSFKVCCFSFEYLCVIFILKIFISCIINEYLF